MAFTGILVGLVFGYTAQRGRFCIKSAFQDIQLFRDYTLFKALLLAIVVQLFGFGLFAAMGWITPEAKPFYGLANVLGGLVFGVGMALAGGCAGSITFRTGEGYGMALTALVGFFLGSVMTAAGLLAPVALAVQSSAPVLSSGESNPTLASIFELPYPAAALGLAVLVSLVWAAHLFRNGLSLSNLLRRGKRQPSGGLGVRSWSWQDTGAVVGLSGVVAFLLSPGSGRNYPLGITHGYVNFYRVAAGVIDDLAWDTWLVAGIIVGSGLAAVLAKEFQLRIPPLKLAAQTFAGGLLMGFGSITAGGCTIGHIVSGVPLLSLGSLLSAVSMFAGSWLMTWLLFHPLKQLQFSPHEMFSSERP